MSRVRVDAASLRLDLDLGGWKCCNCKEPIWTGEEIARLWPGQYTHISCIPTVYAPEADSEPCEFCGDGPCPNGCTEQEAVGA